MGRAEPDVRPPGAASLSGKSIYVFEVGVEVGSQGGDSHIQMRVTANAGSGMRDVTSHTDLRTRDQ